jgi:hypothetical protein
MAGSRKSKEGWVEALPSADEKGYFEFDAEGRFRIGIDVMGTDFNEARVWSEWTPFTSIAVLNVGEKGESRVSANVRTTYIGASSYWDGTLPIEKVIRLARVLPTEMRENLSAKPC